jgi:hypothetical protein
VLNKFLKIVGSQIEIELFLSLAKILISFKACHLQSKNLKNIYLLIKIDPMTLGYIVNPLLAW